MYNDKHSLQNTSTRMFFLFTFYFSHLHWSENVPTISNTPSVPFLIKTEKTQWHWPWHCTLFCAAKWLYAFLYQMIWNLVDWLEPLLGWYQIIDYLIITNADFSWSSSPTVREINGCIYRQATKLNGCQYSRGHHSSTFLDAKLNGSTVF